MKPLTRKPQNKYKSATVFSKKPNALKLSTFKVVVCVVVYVCNMSSAADISTARPRVSRAQAARRCGDVVLLRFVWSVIILLMLGVLHPVTFAFPIIRNSVILHIPILNFLALNVLVVALIDHASGLSVACMKQKCMTTIVSSL